MFFLVDFGEILVELVDDVVFQFLKFKGEPLELLLDVNDFIAIDF